LICKNSTYLSCSCPTTVSNDYYDCPTRFFAIESYCNGSYCVSAKSINESCSYSWQCEQLKGLSCNATSGKCVCSSENIWNGTQCRTFPTSWTYHRGSCFRISSNVVLNLLGLNNTCYDEIELQICYDETTSRFAIIYDSDGRHPTFTDLFDDDYWIDAYRNVSTSTIFYSFYTNLWDLNDPSRNCFRFDDDNGSIKFKDKTCADNNKKMICEIVLQKYNILNTIWFSSPFLLILSYLKKTVLASTHFTYKTLFRFLSIYNTRMIYFLI
jgi:hypothetical protein